MNAFVVNVFDYDRIMSNDGGVKPPQSRRERPSKPALTREGIVEAAMTILEEEGLGKVTMRRIAASLDTGPASLYVYVQDTNELHAQILDALLGRMAPVAPRGSWRDRLKELLVAFGAVLADYPEIARMTMTTHPVGPHYFALVESVLGLLDEGGVSDDVAAWAVDLLLAAVTASAVEHGASKTPAADVQALAAVSTAIASAPSEEFPRIVSLGEEMLSGTGAERFDWSLEVLLNGILSTPRGQSPDS